MNKRQRKKQKTVALQKAYQSLGYTKKRAKQKIGSSNLPSVLFNKVLTNVISRLSEIKSIITQYERDVNSIAQDILATYNVDPMLASWIDKPTILKVDHQLDTWWNKLGFDSYNQFYQNLQSAIDLTDTDFDITNQFAEVVEDCFQAVNNFDKWVRFVELEWNDRIAPIFYASEQIRHDEALNKFNAYTEKGEGLEALLGL